jgi:hypothetical protein
MKGSRRHEVLSILSIHEFTQTISANY